MQVYASQAAPTTVDAECVVVLLSSRRRHTRFKCDWSSDVCSSDLKKRERERERARRSICAESLKNKRSEERRVGKECRSRWSPYHSKKHRSTYKQHTTQHHTQTHRDRHTQTRSRL